MKLKLIDPTEGFFNLIDKNAELEVISQGHQFTEGPVWDKKNKRLLFSDIPANTIFQWNEKDGTAIYRKPSHFSNGLVFDHAGHLVICEHQRRALTLDDGSEEVKILADSFANCKLNSPNDVVVASDGSIIFTDPIYGLRPGNGGPAKQELPFQGVFRLSPDRKNLILITDSFERPNGLALTADGKKLFIIDTVKQHIRVYDINENWECREAGIWAELWDDNYTSRPDGMKFDHQGNLFTTGPGGIWIFDEHAVLLGRIILPDKTSNLAWGGPDFRSIFITSSDKVYKLQCLTGGN